MDANMQRTVDTGLRRQRWADFSDDDTESAEWGVANVAEQVSAPAQRNTLPSAGRRCWADMVSDDEECPSPCSTMAPPSEFDEVSGFLLRPEEADDSDRDKEEEGAAVAKAHNHEDADVLLPGDDWLVQKEKKQAKKEAKQHKKESQVEEAEEAGWQVAGSSKRNIGNRQQEFDQRYWWDSAATKASSSTAVPSGGSGSKATRFSPPQSAPGMKQDQTHKPAYPVHSKPAPAPAPARAPRGRHATKRGQTQCQFYIGIEEEPDFSVVRRVLGRHGSNMKRIAFDTGSKLRLRGLGSGFSEGPELQESTDPLMLCISAPDIEAYLKTKELVTELLEDVYRQYRAHCQRRRVVPEGVKIHVHEGFRSGSH